MKRKVEILQHALGLNRQSKPYRNYYCVAIGGGDFKLLMEMCRDGLCKAGTVINDGYDQYFNVTEAGIEFAKGVENERTATVRR